MGTEAGGGRPLRAGDWVEVRSAAEILATLDERGMLNGMPFMTEMLPYCGRRYRVAASAHKSCDTIHYTGMRDMGASVHLEGLRCDGSGHGGCQAGCLFFWKEIWLRRVEGPVSSAGAPAAEARQQPVDTAALEKGARRQGDSADDVRYVCQITELLNCSKPVAWWNPRQYWRDWRSGNRSLGQIVAVLSTAAARRMTGFGVGYRFWIAVHDWLARRFDMPSYDAVTNRRGPIAQGVATPLSNESFQTGEWVRVRPRAEILASLNTAGRNRGLTFDPEMLYFCERTYQVRGVVERIIEEGTGKMQVFKNPCIALENAYCRGEFSRQRLLCPRAIIPYWRPLWLQKVPPPGGAGQG